MPKIVRLRRKKEAEKYEKALNDADLTLCPKCLRIPLIQLVFEKVHKIQISCSCGFIEKIDLDKYMKNTSMRKKSNPKCERVLSHYLREGILYCTQCRKWLCKECSVSHSLWIKNHEVVQVKSQLEKLCSEHGEEFEFFCITCKVHFCKECQEKHSSHDIKVLNEYFNERKMKRVKENYQEVLKDYSISYTKIKDFIIGELEKKINSVNEAFEYNKSVNDRIFNFLNLLYETYSVAKNNYYAMTNILSNSYFQLPRFKLVPDDNFTYVGDFITFLKSKFVDVVEKVDMKKLTQEKTILENEINSLCLLDSGKLASCSWEKDIKIFNTETFECEMTISGHTDSVTYVSQLENGKLLSCSMDKTIKVWELYDNDNYQCEGTLEGHEHWIYKVIPLSQQRIASCSFDKTIRVWSGEKPYNCLQILSGHYSYVYSIIQLKNTECLVSGSGNDENTLRFWNLDVYKLYYTVNNILCGWVNSLFEIEDTKLAVGGNKTVVVVNLENLMVEQVIQNEELNFVRCFALLRDGSLLLGCENGHVARLDLNVFRIDFNQKIHEKGVKTLITLGEKIIASGSVDKEIKIWKY